MTRSDTAIALLAPHGADPEVEHILQAFNDLQRPCPTAMSTCDAASDSRGTQWSGVEQPVHAREVETVTYRVTVAFSVSSEELEAVVEEQMCHPHSTDVRVEVVRASR